MRMAKLLNIFFFIKNFQHKMDTNNSEFPFSFQSLLISNKNFEETMKILEIRGEKIQNFTWTQQENLNSSDLIKILNFLPNLEEFYFNFNNKIYFNDEILEKSREILKFTEEKIKNLKLRKIFISTNEIFSISKFFALFLPKNSIFDLTFNIFSDKPRKICENFFKTQKMIKKLKISFFENFESLKFLELEELILLEKFELENFKKVLETQKNLKILKMKSFEINDEKFFEEIFKLSKLEILKIKFKSFKNVENMINLKNLKKIYFEGNFDLKFIEKFSNLKLKFLEKLILLNSHETFDFPSEIFSNFNENFPNLKTLKLKSKQKLNSFAKFLPNLEKLFVDYENLKFLEIQEFDTEISSHKIKSLEINLNFIDEEFCSENLTNIFEIFPNLESFKVKNGKKL